MFEIWNYGPSVNGKLGRPLLIIIVPKLFQFKCILEASNMWIICQTTTIAQALMRILGAVHQHLADQMQFGFADYKSDK